MRWLMVLLFMASCGDTTYDYCDFVGDSCNLWVGDIGKDGVDDGFAPGMCLSVSTGYEGQQPEYGKMRCILECIDGWCDLGVEGGGGPLGYGTPITVGSRCYCVPPNVEL